MTALISTIVEDIPPLDTLYIPNTSFAVLSKSILNSSYSSIVSISQLVIKQLKLSRELVILTFLAFELL